jgi:hypothetical protein
MSTEPRLSPFSAMSTAQRQAWFNLVIISLALGTILVLTPSLGFRRAQGGVAFLGLLGLAPFLFRKRAGRVFMDERDILIQSRAWTVAYAVFWIVFVAVCVSAPFTFGSSGAVPVEWVQMSVWYGFMLVWGTSSVATLAQYRWGALHATE